MQRAKSIVSLEKLGATYHHGCDSTGHQFHFAMLNGVVWLPKNQSHHWSVPEKRYMFLPTNLSTINTKDITE
jgi:hypothetical protein